MGIKKDIEKNLAPSIEAFGVIFQKLQIKDGDTVVIKSLRPLTNKMYQSVAKGLEDWQEKTGIKFCGVILEETLEIFKLKINKIEVLEQLKEYQKAKDVPLNHINADEILCDLLKALGFVNIVEEYEKIPKWYS